MLQQIPQPPLGAKKPASRRDFFITVTLTLLTLVLAYIYDISETWYEWAAIHEDWEVDEIPLSLSILSLGLTWFTIRRGMEFRNQVFRTEQANKQLRAEIDRRIVIEADLDAARVQSEALAAEAQRANQAKSAFLANMSHEVRTPLNGVLGMAGLLLDTPLDDNQQECAETILQSGESLLTVLNDILDFSKIEAGKLELEASDFDVATLVDSAVELLAPQAHGKGLEIPTYVSSSVPSKLRGDDGRIRQVLLNLISNAVKFTESGGVSIEVSVYLEESRDEHVVLRVEVTDTGIGIPETMQEHVFEEFSQVDGSTSRQYGGTGLGLAICKRLVVLMHGQIGAKNCEEGGSLFWFTVCLERCEGATSWAHKVQDDLRNSKILVVDDNHVNRRVFEKQLGDLGADVTLAVNAESALVKLRMAADGDRPFDVAFIDHMMPGTDGLDLAAMIREAPWAHRTSLVLSSSSGMINSNSKARAYGFDAALPKPLRPGALKKCIHSLFKSDGVERPAQPARAPQDIVTDHMAKRILLAEDNRVNQKVIVRMLKKQGYSVDTVMNGLEAIESLRNIPYALVLMDIQMPEMDGFEAVRHIRQSQKASAKIPIIGVTAHALKGDRERIIEAGMNDYLTKPIDREMLLAKVAYWITPEAKDQPKAETASGE